MKNKLLKAFLIGTLFAFFWQGSIAQQTLIISEVADPGDDYNGRFVELYNATNSSIDLGAGSYYLARQANGGNFDNIQLTGTIASGETYVIGTSSFESIYGFAAEITSGSISGNGDDGYFIYSGGDNTTGTLVDAYGVIDQDGSGQGWEYTDSRAVRNQDIGTANTTWTASEWTISTANTADMTPGTHTCDYPSAADTDPPAFVNSTPFVEKVIENRFDLVAALDEPGTVYFKLVPDGATAPSIADIKAANSLTITEADTDYSVTSSDTLQTNTAYDLYVVAEDDEATPNTQASATLVEFTTSDTRALDLTAPTGGETFYSGDTVDITWTQSNVGYVNFKVYDPSEAQWFFPDDVYKKVDATLGTFKLPIPEDALTNANYRLAIQDWADETLADSTTNFEIQDTITPKVANTVPADDASDVFPALSALEIGFTEYIQKGSGSIEINLASDDSNLETVDIADVTLNDTTAVIPLTVAMEPGTGYYVNIPATAFSDISGNAFEGISDATTWNFTTGSLTTISEIQDTTGTGSEASPLAGNTITTKGIVVDTVDGAYYIADAAGAWNGIKVIDGSNMPNPGDQILIMADVAENYNYTRLENITQYNAVSSGNQIPAKTTVTTNEAAQEKYEGVHLYIDGATCTNPDANYGQWVIDDGSGSIIVDDDYYAYTATLDATYNITGFGHYSFSERKILPTEAEDIELIYTGPSIDDTYIDPNAPISSDDVYVYADVNDVMHTLDTIFLAYGTSAGELNDTLGMIVTKQWYQNAAVIPAQPDETTVYYQITAINTNEDTTVSSEMSYTVKDPEMTTLPYSEGFNSDLGDIYTYSVSGETKNWYHSSDDGGVAEANGYNSGDLEDDWMILPGIDFSQYSNDIRMVFSSYYNYGTDDVDNYLKLKYSSDYEGTGDPTSATWTEISFTKPSESEVWTSTGEINLPDTNSTNVYIALQYHYNSGSYRNWKIDSINVYDASAPIIKNYTHEPAIPVVGDQVDIMAEVTDAAGLDTVYTAWGTASGVLEDTIGMVIESGELYKTETPIPDQAEGTEVFYAITAVNSNSAMSVTPEQSYTVKSYPEVSIYDIQYTTDESGDSPYLGQTVTTTGIVTAYEEGAYFVQNGQGPWNGVYVYDYNNSPSIGDEVEFSALVDEYYNLTELKDVSNFTVLSSDNPLPTPDTITPRQATTEMYEGVFIRMESVECIADTAEVGYGQWEVADADTSIYIDDMLYEFGPTKGAIYNITGVGYYSFSERKVLPRMETDIEFAGNVEPNITNVSIAPTSPTADDDVQVNATIIDENEEDNITAELLYGTSSDDISNTATFSNEGTGDPDVYGGIIPAQAAGSTVYFEIHASDNDTTSIYEGNYQVEDQADGIEDQISLSLKVYPNPGNGQFAVEFEETMNKPYEVSVYNMVGKLVYQQQFNNVHGKQTIDITGQNDGIYYLKVKSEKGEKVLKLIKQ